MIHNVLASTPLAPYEITLIVIGVVLGLALLWLILNLVIAHFVLKSATHPRVYTLDETRAMQIKSENLDFSDYDSVWKKQDFEVDGTHGKIRGEVVFNETPSKRKKVAIICHGFTMNRINSVKYATIFYKRGYSLVLYDHAHFGLSDGDFCTLGCFEKRDLSVVIDYVRATFGDDAYIALHGESMGAATVLSELGIRNDIDLVVADCPFSDTMSYYKELFTHLFKLPSFPAVELSGAMAKRKYGYDYTQCSPLNDVKGSNVPICFVHGKADDFIYPHHSEDMFKVCVNPLSELHLVDNAKHACSFMEDNAVYDKIVGDFIEKVESQTL